MAGKTTKVVRRIGLYPGAFDPITKGHLDIIKRGVKLVDRLIIGVGVNPGKEPMFSIEERVAMARAETASLVKNHAADIEVAAFDCLLMDFAKSKKANIIIRGLRAVSDFEYEFQMAGMNQHLNPDVETVFLMADAALQPIASHLVKEIAYYGGAIEDFVPRRVAKAVREKVQPRRKHKK